VSKNEFVQETTDATEDGEHVDAASDDELIDNKGVIVVIKTNETIGCGAIAIHEQFKHKHKHAYAGHSHRTLCKCNVDDKSSKWNKYITWNRSGPRGV
jgi:hypothetical protein